MSRSHTERNQSFPTNVYFLRAKIAGIEVSRLLGIVVSICISALLFQVDLVVSMIFLISSLLLMLLNYKGEMFGLLLIRVLSYSIRRKEGIISKDFLVTKQNGLTFITRNGQIALVVRTTGANVSFFKNEYAERYFVTVRTLLDVISCNLEVVGIPSPPDLNKYRIEETDEYSREYNTLVEYVFSGCYYYDVHLILKGRLSQGKEILTMSRIEDDYKKVREKLLSIGFKCEGVHGTEELRNFLRDMQ